MSTMCLDLKVHAASVFVSQGFREEGDVGICDDNYGEIMRSRPLTDGGCQDAGPNSQQKAGGTYGTSH